MGRRGRLRPSAAAADGVSTAKRVRRSTRSSIGSSATAAEPERSPTPLTSPRRRVIIESDEEEEEEVVIPVPSKRTDEAVEPKREKSSPKRRIQQKELDDEDEVLEEFPVVLIRPPAGSSVSRLLFAQSQPSHLSTCSARLKHNVKHLELNFETPRTAEGRPISRRAAMYDGVYTGESQSVGADQLRHAVGFFDRGEFLMIPVTDTYEMGRRLGRPMDVDLRAHHLIEDANLAAELSPTSHQATVATPLVNPVRVRFARPESDWQRKRREQSAHHRQLLFDRDPWVEMGVEREVGFVSIHRQFQNPRSCYAPKIAKARDSSPARIRDGFKPPPL